MVLRTRKSLGRISALFNNVRHQSSQNQELKPSHLIWILLSSASAGPQYADLCSESIDRLVKTLKTDKGINSVVQLKNTSPACTLSGSKAISAKASSASVLVYVDGSDIFQATLDKLTALLEYGGIATSADGTAALHWSLTTYSSIQFHEPKRSKDLTGECIVIVAISPSAGQDEDVDNWYRKEHLAQLSGTPLFLRCRRYTRFSDLSRTEEGGVQDAKAFLAVHDYTSVQDLFDHSLKHGQLVEETAWTRRVMDGAKAVERTIWTVVR